MLKTEGISFSVGSKQLLQETTLQFQPGLFHVIIGANGAGKSTLLKLLAGDLKPTSGKIFLSGRELNTFSKKQLATKRAVLSQQYNLSFPITVQDIVGLNRTKASKLKIEGQVRGVDEDLQVTAHGRPLLFAVPQA